MQDCLQQSGSHSKVEHMVCKEGIEASNRSSKCKHQIPNVIEKDGALQHEVEAVCIEPCVARDGLVRMLSFIDPDLVLGPQIPLLMHGLEAPHQHQFGMLCHVRQQDQGSQEHLKHAQCSGAPVNHLIDRCVVWRTGHYVDEILYESDCEGDIEKKAVIVQSLAEDETHDPSPDADGTVELHLQFYLRRLFKEVPHSRLGRLTVKVPDEVLFGGEWEIAGELGDGEVDALQGVAEDKLDATHPRSVELHVLHSSLLLHHVGQQSVTCMARVIQSAQHHIENHARVQHFSPIQPLIQVRVMQEAVSHGFAAFRGPHGHGRSRELVVDARVVVVVLGKRMDGLYLLKDSKHRELPCHSAVYGMIAMPFQDPQKQSAYRLLQGFHFLR
mmetsp:Transcript_23957/g.39382  ORF Transcript_23957/g.39382 Transcript_23957/m.39382 type:complete len:385 (+) Transcript_23957:1267-2421(+)